MIRRHFLLIIDRFQLQSLMEQNPLIQSICTLNTFPLNPWPILRLDPVLQWETADHTINTPSFAYYRLIMQYHGERGFQFQSIDLYQVHKQT